MTRARDPNLTERLAGALLGLDYWQALAASYELALCEWCAREVLEEAKRRGEQSRIISYQEAKNLTNEKIVGRWECDHYPVRMADREALSAAGIPDINHASNLTWRPRAEHREKTSKVDVPAIAKGKRIRVKVYKAGGFALGADAEPSLMRPRLRSKGFDTTKTRGKRVVRDSALAELRKFSPELDVALTELSLLHSRSRIASRGFDKTKTRGFDNRVRPRKPKRMR